jgi:hypothetical protein
MRTKTLFAIAFALFAAAANAQTLTIYDDALQNGFADYSFGGGTNFNSTAQAHTGTKSVSILGHSFNALSFEHAPGGIITTLHTANTPILRFWVNGGTASGQQFHIGLQNNGAFVGTAAALDAYIAGGGIGLGVWRQVTIDLRQPPFNAVDFDRIDIQSDENAGTDASATYVDDMVLGQPVVAPTSTIQIDHDVMVASITSDRFTWRDGNGFPRVASLAHNDAEVNNGSHGGALREYKFQLSNGQTRTATVTTYGNAGYGGFGYVTLHSSRYVGCNGDDSPLGLQFSGHWQRIFEGRHHVIFRFTQLYPRNCPTSGPVITRYLPVTIDWMFSTGRDNPVWAVTYDVDQISDGVNPAVGADMYWDDSRAPYGELNIDGEGFTNLNGVAWGDRYRFTTTNAPGTDVTWNSPFNWTATNTVPFVKEWLDGPLNAGRLDATMGIVQTQSITQQDAGGARDLGVGSDITPYWHKTDADNVHSAGAHTLPDGNNWPYQAMGNNFFSNAGSNNARMTWKTQFGFIGQTAYTINGGAVESSAATAPGYPRKSYSTYVVLGQHSTAPEPVDDQRAYVETITNANNLTLSINGGIGSVVTSGPAGITRADNVTYAPAGYNHVYGALAFSASSSNLDANIAIAAGTLKKPLIIVSNYTTGADPQAVKLAGVTLAADVDYFASVRASANELWITLNRDLSGAANRLEITGGGAALATPKNFGAAATSTSQVTISWTAVAGAANYEIQRSVNNSAFAMLTTIAGTTYNDGGLTANTTYLYKVRAINGATSSGFTPIDPATTILFTDDPINAGVLPKAVHVTQLRTAVNAMRAAAGLGSQPFIDPALATGGSIKAIYVTELRTALDQARSTIGLTAIVYVDPTITTNLTGIKAAHLTDLRNGVK